MKHFLKLPGVLQVFMADFLMVMFLSRVVIKSYEKVRPPASGRRILPLRVSDYVLFVIGLLIFAWLLKTIFRPSVGVKTFATESHGNVNFPFSSTHPSYVLIDALSSGFYWFLLMLWYEAWKERVYEGTILVALAMVIPLLRLLAWYVLRLRPQGREHLQEEVRDAWKPVVMLYCMFVIPVALAIVGGRLYIDRQQEQRAANLTVVDTANWKGSETFDALHERGDTATRMIRLRATQKSPEATVCTDEAGHPFGTVLATLGKFDDVLIVSFSKYQEGVDELVERARGNTGKPIEAIGRLSQMPDKIPAWKRYCGLEKLQQRPRWVFEEEYP